MRKKVKETTDRQIIFKFGCQTNVSLLKSVPLSKDIEVFIPQKVEQQS